MRRFSLGVTLVALPVFALSLMLAGCGGGNTSSSGGGGDTGPKKKKPKKEAKFLEPGKGVLKGKITLNGKPDYAALNAQLMEDMKKKDGEYCMKGSETETTQQAYRVSDKGLLGNVFVWIVPEDKKYMYFKVDEKQLPEQKVMLRQPHCAFIPHCAFLFVEYPDPKNPKKPKPTGQVLEIHNDATITHNTNWLGTIVNKGNELLKEGKIKVVKNLIPDTGAVTVKCDIHGWMRAYLRVVDTPYYDISKSDTLDGKDKVEKSDPKFGTYEIKNLPEGKGKVKVIVWHEECGYLNKNGGQGEEIEILPGKPTEKDFEAPVK